MQAGFRQAEHRDIDHLACLTHARVGNIADQKRIVAFLLGLDRVIDDFFGIVIFEEPVMCADARSLGQALHMHRSTGIRRSANDFSQIGAVRYGLRLPRQTLIPKFHRVSSLKP